MTREQYLQNRKTLMDEAQNLINEGKVEEANAKMAEVTSLDNKFEEEAKAQANLNAMQNSASSAGIQKAAVGGVSGAVVGSMGDAAKDDDMFDSAEYKRAFQAYVLRGAPIPEKFANSDANTKTADVGSVIPSTTLQKIYTKMEELGMVLPMVTRTGYKGGLSVPTSTAKPTASWVAEGVGSDKQKYTTGSVTFSYHKLRCAVSMSYETDNMAYPMFETMFVNGVADAMVKAKEIAIINGTGSGQPKGILKETAKANIDIAKGSSITYADLCAAEGDEESERAVWAMTKKTFMTQIQGMVDADKQPVARVNYGLSGRPEYTILGRRVVLLNSDYIASWSAAPSTAAVIAFMYDFSDYIFNSGVPMAIKRYYDENVDDTICKAVEVCDGKSVRNDSLVTITLKNA